MLAMPHHLLHLLRAAHARLHLRQAHHLARDRRPCTRKKQDGREHSKDETLLHNSILHLRVHGLNQ